MRLHLALCFAFALTLGCEPDAPARDDAVAFYQGHEAELAALESSVAEAVGAIPWLEVAEPPCDEPPSDGPEGESPFELRMRSMRCTQQRLARTEERDEAISRMESEVLPAVTEAAGALSLRLVYRRAGSDYPFHLGAVEPAPPTARDGAVRARYGAHVDERHSVGWGLFASRYTDANGVPHGDESFVRGYEVRWTFEVGDAEIAATAFFLDPG